MAVKQTPRGLVVGLIEDEVKTKLEAAASTDSAPVEQDAVKKRTSKAPAKRSK